MADKNSKPATVDEVQRVIDKSVFKMVSEAIDAILNGMQKMFDTQDKKIDNNTNLIEQNSQKIDRLQTEFKYIRDDIKGLEGEFATTVTRPEFDSLKARVDKYHPLN